MSCWIGSKLTTMTAKPVSIATFEKLLHYIKRNNLLFSKSGQIMPAE